MDVLLALKLTSSGLNFHKFPSDFQYEINKEISSDPPSFNAHFTLINNRLINFHFGRKARNFVLYLVRYDAKRKIHCKKLSQ